MRLNGLDPQFYKIASPGHYQHVETLAEAQGIMFDCPKCGNHSVMVWFRDRGVPVEEVPGPGRWSVSGTIYADLSLSPSINLENPQHVGCEWHGFVTNGDVT